MTPDKIEKTQYVTGLTSIEKRVDDKDEQQQQQKKQNQKRNKRKKIDEIIEEQLLNDSDNGHIDFIA